MPLRLAVLVVALLALAAPADAASTRDKAERALERVREARGEQLTPALRDLFRRRAALTGPDRRAADAYFARPTDAPPAEDDGQVYYGNAKTEPPHCSPRFCVHYVAAEPHAPPDADEDADGVPDYVERVLVVLEYVRTQENGVLGWELAPPDGARGGGAQLDAYLADIGDGVYGYVAADGDQENDGSLHSFLVLDDDFAGFGGDPALRVTAAHEYNHVLQFGANADLGGEWAFEATATWMEDRVYPDVEDYFQYIRPWSLTVDRPLTREGLAQYGSAVWNQYLDTRFGPEVVRDVWERSARFEDALSAYDRFVPGGFSPAFGAFAAATAAWKAEARAFPDGPDFSDELGPIEPVRSAPLAVDGDGLGRILDHTSYTLHDVTARGGAAIRLEAAFPADVAGSIALVGGPASGRGPVKRAVADAPAGGTVSVDFEDPAAYQRVTAVLANADPRYDAVEVSARVITRPAPRPPAADPVPTATPTPVPTPAPPVVDTTGPLVVIPSANRSLRASRSGIVRFGLGPMAEPTSGSVTLRTASRVRVRGRRRVLSFGSTTFRASAGKRIAARVRLGRSARRVLRARGKLRVEATVTVRDAAGSPTTRTYRFTLRAPKRR